MAGTRLLSKNHPRDNGLIKYGELIQGFAKELGIEPSTEKYHVINMLQKTNLENKLQLAIAATEAKLVVELAEE